VNPVRLVGSALVGLSVAWLASCASLPDGVAVALGALAGLIMLRSPPAVLAKDVLPPSPLVGPTVDIGRVTYAPPQTNPIFAGQRFELALAELERHVTLIGSTGSGKTTTIGRLIDAAVQVDWSVMVVDAKGGRLVDVCHAIGASRDVPSRIWLPGHAETWTYDMCVGDPAAISNRIVGAFDHGREGQVYRNLSQALVPLAIQALINTGRRCTLDTLRYSLELTHLAGLARREPDDALRNELIAMLSNKLHKEALSGIAGRLRALRFGVFGPSLLPSDRTIDLAVSLNTPGITYLGLPATAASEDVALVGRVLLQHLKQVAYAALWSDTPRPGLIVLDEFASLGEAVQLIDLLLQAREARLAVAVSTQHLPKEPVLRKALLSAGALIVHQTGASEDTELIARTLGSRSGTEVVQQFQFGPAGPLARRYLRRRDAFLVTPDELAGLPVGRAAICVRSAHQRIGLVQVDPLRVNQRS
jgi:hypothetical protein